MKTFILAAVAVLGLSLGVANAVAPVGNHSTAWSSGENFTAGGGGSNPTSDRPPSMPAPSAGLSKAG